MGTFALTVAKWTQDVIKGHEIIFRESCGDLVQELNLLVPVRTGFLRQSLEGSKTAMPSMNKHPPKMAGIYPLPDPTGLLAFIETVETGETIYLGYTATYAASVHYGHSGHPGSPWVDLVAQRWPMIVSKKAQEVKVRLGL